MNSNQHSQHSQHSSSSSHRSDRDDRDRDDRKRRRDSEDRDHRRGDRGDRDRDRGDRDYRGGDRDDRDRREHFGRRGPAELNTLRDIRSALNYQNRLLEQFVGAENVRLVHEKQALEKQERLDRRHNYPNASASASSSHRGGDRDDHDERDD